MPVIIGQVKIANISGGTIRNGDIFYQADKSSTKSSLGSGASNTGVFISTINGVSISNVITKCVAEQPIVGNK
ncbi:spore germination protein [Bacillus sp. 2205SS5-2]|uniref:spore germination protein n=1 Tax=Bacillus sp. 2205SS5-2 TaxID=3109031 RepID=UPI0030073041